MAPGRDPKLLGALQPALMAQCAKPPGPVVGRRVRVCQACELSRGFDGRHTMIVVDPVYNLCTLVC